MLVPTLERNTLAVFAPASLSDLIANEVIWHKGGRGDKHLGTNKHNPGTNDYLSGHWDRHLGIVKMLTQ